MFESWGGVADAQVATEVAGVRPGPDLAAALDRAELPDVSDDAVLELIAGWTRLASWAAAGQAGAVAELARRRLDGPLDAAGRSPRDGTPSEFTADELAVTLCLPVPTAARLLDFAIALDRLPGTRDALTAGVIDVARAKVITSAVAGLPEATGRAIEDEVLDEAGEQTSGQLRAATGRAVLAVDPAAAVTQTRRAARDRKVIIYPDPADGMARLCADLPGPDAVAVWAALDAAARAAGATDPRSMDARRADALVWLCTGQLALYAPAPDATTTASASTPTPAADSGPTEEPGQPSPGVPAGSTFAAPPRWRVELGIHIGLDVLTGLSQAPAHLAGYGWISAETARTLLADATGSAYLSIVDPRTGALLGLSAPHPFDPTDLPRTRARPPDEDDEPYDDSWIPRDWPPRRAHPGEDDPPQDWPREHWPPEDDSPDDDPEPSWAEDDQPAWPWPDHEHPWPDHEPACPDD